MSQNIDENNQNELKEQTSLNSSRPNPIKSGLLRPSAFQNSSSSSEASSSSSTIRPSVLKIDDSSSVVSTSNPFLNNSSIFKRLLEYKISSARPDDITNLFNEINKRIDLQKSRTPSSSTNDEVTSDSNENSSLEK